MNVEKENIDELITQLLSGNLKEEDQEQLRRWVNQSEDNKKYFRRLEEIWLAAASQDDKLLFDKEKAYLRFRLRTDSCKEDKQPMSTRKRSIYSIIGRVAAVAMLCLLFSGLGYWGSSEATRLQYADISVEAPYGAKTKLYLPDGTLVWLNAGSSIKYSQGFGIHDRKLTLTGEAYFEVTKDEKKTFEVTADDLTVRVLGTKFNFRNYADEEEARVTLLEGKVSVKNAINGEEVKLDPNQQAAYDKTTLVSSIVDVKAKRSSEWTKGIIFFDEERLPDITRELERLYNVQITIKDESLKNYRFYGSFYRTDQTIQEVMDVLSSTNRLRYMIDGKQIILSSQ